MIVSPPQDYKYSADSHFASLTQNVNQSMTRAAIILDRETKDITPLVTLSLPALALVTFYGKNQAFIPNSGDKFLKRTFKSAGQKVTDFVSSSTGKAWKYTKELFNKSGHWTRYNVGETFSELKGIFGGKLSGLGRALRDDARDVIKALLRR
ncbi:hypothetical protein IKQ26_06170 [bacterium]|nr:hypothetical protein [bacterium]